jgi:hypothetical protein
VAASQAEKPTDPYENPTRFNQTADLAGVHAVAYHPQNPFGIQGGLTTGDTMSGTNMFNGGSIRAFGAELLDSTGKAM